jgi:hypothetical protein
MGRSIKSHRSLNSGYSKYFRFYISNLLKISCTVVSNRVDKVKRESEVVTCLVIKSVPDCSTSSFGISLVGSYTKGPLNEHPDVLGNTIYDPGSKLTSIST